MTRFLGTEEWTMKRHRIVNFFNEKHLFSSMLNLYGQNTEVQPIWNEVLRRYAEHKKRNQRTMILKGIENYRGMDYEET